MPSLTLPYPPSANRYLRHTVHGSYRTAEADAYRKTAFAMARAAGIQKPVDGTPVFVSAILHPRLTRTGAASRTRLDIDNCIKVVLDALQGIAYDNDRQVRKLTLEIGYPIEKGGLTLEVSHG